VRRARTGRRRDYLPIGRNEVPGLASPPPPATAPPPAPPPPPTSANVGLSTAAAPHPCGNLIPGPPTLAMKALLSGAVLEPVMGVCATAPLTVPDRGRAIPVTCARIGLTELDGGGGGNPTDPFASPRADLGLAIRAAKGVGAAGPVAKRLAAGGSVDAADVADRADAPVICRFRGAAVVAAPVC
jgi:hypothetical protein